MNTLRALRPLAGVGALFGAALLALSLLVSNGVTFAIVPPPETEAESLVRALKARRFNAVRGGLSEALNETLGDEQLEDLFARVRRTRVGISDAHGESSIEQQDTAAATVRVKLEDKTEETLEFPLAKEHGLWRVASIEPLGRLTR